MTGAVVPHLRQGLHCNPTFCPLRKCHVTTWDSILILPMGHPIGSADLTCLEQVQREEKQVGPPYGSKCKWNIPAALAPVLDQLALRILMTVFKPLFASTHAWLLSNLAAARASMLITPYSPSVLPGLLLGLREA